MPSCGYIFFFSRKSTSHYSNLVNLTPKLETVDVSPSDSHCKSITMLSSNVLPIMKLHASHYGVTCFPLYREAVTACILVWSKDVHTAVLPMQQCS